MKHAKGIDKFSFGYEFLRVLPIRFAFRRYYRKMELHYHESIPAGIPVILAPNHQNALMDAMAFVGPMKKHQVVFFARADIFKKDFIARVLKFMKIMPVYRKRDGASNLQKNDEIFDSGAQFLQNKLNPICLFPEGNHGEFRRLRPLVKGIFRIAFKAQSEYGSQQVVRIYPVGIDYGHYQKFRNTLLVNFGAPIEVADYWQAYDENNAVAINKLRDDLASKMRELMIDIRTEEYYDLYMGLRSVYTGKLCNKMGLKGRSLLNRFRADKKLIAALDTALETAPERIDSLNRDFADYAAIRDKHNLRDWVFNKAKYSILISGIKLFATLPLLPLVLLGLINNWPHFFLPPMLTKGIKDQQFVSTFKWGTGLLIMYIYYLLLIIAGVIWIPEWWMKAAYILTLWQTGLLSYWFRNVWVKNIARIRYTWRRKGDLAKAYQLHQQIVSQLNAITQ